MNETEWNGLKKKRVNSRAFLITSLLFGTIFLVKESTTKGTYVDLGNFVQISLLLFFKKKSGNTCEKRKKYQNEIIKTTEQSSEQIHKRIIARC